MNRSIFPQHLSHVTWEGNSGDRTENIYRPNMVNDDRTMTEKMTKQTKKAAEMGLCPYFTWINTPKSGVMVTGAKQCLLSSVFECPLIYIWNLPFYPLQHQCFMVSLNFMDEVHEKIEPIHGRQMNSDCQIIAFLKIHFKSFYHLSVSHKKMFLLNNETHGQELLYSFILNDFKHERCSKQYHAMQKWSKVLTNQSKSWCLLIMTKISKIAYCWLCNQMSPAMHYKGFLIEKW